MKKIVIRVSDEQLEHVLIMIVPLLSRIIGFTVANEEGSAPLHLEAPPMKAVKSQTAKVRRMRRRALSTPSTIILSLFEQAPVVTYVEVRAAAKKHNIHMMSLRNAIHGLKSKGIIVRVPGAGDQHTGYHYRLAEVEKKEAS